MMTNTTVADGGDDEQARRRAAASCLLCCYSSFDKITRIVSHAHFRAHQARIQKFKKSIFPYQGGKQK
jgi:hypothetical protein